MKSRGWEIEISNAGHIVTQIIKRLGIQFSQVFAIKGIINLLGSVYIFLAVISIAAK